MTDGPLDDAEVEAMLREVGRGGDWHPSGVRFANLPALTAEELGELGLAIVDRMGALTEMAEGTGEPGRLLARHSLLILGSLATAVAEAGYSIGWPGMDA